AYERGRPGPTRIRSSPIRAACWSERLDVVASSPLPASVDTLTPDRPKRIVIVASNPAVSEQTGWSIGFWWAELAHHFVELTEHGSEVDIASPDGGPLRADFWSDPRDKSGYSAEDLISLGFINS